MRDRDDPCLCRMRKVMMGSSYPDLDPTVPLEGSDDFARRHKGQYTINAMMAAGDTVNIWEHAVDENAVV
jgi:hypothetical protein